MKRRDVCFWHKADIGDVALMSAFGGKADMTIALRNVR